MGKGKSAAATASLCIPVGHPIMRAVLVTEHANHGLFQAQGIQHSSRDRAHPVCLGVFVRLASDGGQWWPCGKLPRIGCRSTAGTPSRKFEDAPGIFANVSEGEDSGRHRQPFLRRFCSCNILHHLTQVGIKWLFEKILWYEIVALQMVIYRFKSHSTRNLFHIWNERINHQRISLGTPRR